MAMAKKQSLLHQYERQYKTFAKSLFAILCYFHSFIMQTIRKHLLLTLLNSFTKLLLLLSSNPPKEGTFHLPPPPHSLFEKLFE